ncbi:hypothetical protein HPG69_012862 [Diceros bicornis minor]|uniref:Peptidase S1 domain-containing protein n=1 Tax=Diceros bicornis minor TaxID=77932 RepID=A0A7J7F148_DICBM|nr:hypothetical protein HPG69_012862 [Diceros bicornis minor]
MTALNEESAEGAGDTQRLARVSGEAFRRRKHMSRGFWLDTVWSEGLSETESTAFPASPGPLQARIRHSCPSTTGPLARPRPCAPPGLPPGREGALREGRGRGGADGIPGGPRGGGCLGLLVWLLLLQPGLSEAWAGGDGAQGGLAPPPSSPPPSGVGREDPRASLRTPPPEGVPGSSGAPRIPYDRVCGRVIMKMLGGKEAEEGEWPWQVSVRISGRHVCGGSLVTKQWVLTAGHWILNRFHYSVKMGSWSVYKEITSMFSKVGTIQNDPALLQLLYPINFAVTIQPVCIPKETFQVEAGTRCWVTGWGRREEFGETVRQEANSGRRRQPYPWSGELYSYILQEVDQYIIYYDRCNQVVQKAMSTNKDVVLKGMICGYKDAGKDACQLPYSQKPGPDSGGPLVCEFNETWVQLGIVSWGIGCGCRNVPAVYIDVDVYTKWLVTVVNQATSLYLVVFLILPLCLVLPLGILATP